MLRTHKFYSEDGAVKENAYDMVINGVEVGVGSVRIHPKTLQQKMFTGRDVIIDSHAPISEDQLQELNIKIIKIVCFWLCYDFPLPFSIPDSPKESFFPFSSKYLAILLASLRVVSQGFQS